MIFALTAVPLELLYLVLIITMYEYVYIF